MTDYIRLPRSALTDDLWANDGALLRVYMYLVRQSENGVAHVSTAQIIRATKLTERRVRDALTTLETSDKTSSKRSNPKSTKFTPPTDEEVAAYVAEKDYHFDPAAFVPFYQSKGWMVGKTPMKDWRASCRTWEIEWKKKYGTKFYYEIGQQVARPAFASQNDRYSELERAAEAVLRNAPYGNPAQND